MHHKYCKAYHLRDLRLFRDWSQHAKMGESDLSDDSVVYLRDDFTVVTVPILPDAQVIWDSNTVEWQEFCHATLGFAIPEDLQPLYEEQGASSA
ncbi:MAG TPA: hypothetical protein VFB60_14315 [Ktedonobacteraceae bacterium]|nr:hypothetical protein [Ktedonobacteraceae bacterium]